ncbi:4'-phosphopantetheinyl transferase [Moraxella macacae 0408225]|uniref:4'-phosphopantetheinyl transferase n=1 Tax=Moraxella macacae 0408225 TaxID=1230338 RepID=L2F8B5_9GAMM|nr:4'-phosphopantetheinyl transferase superfamily protein [Moraxella macacae]ELA08703.1 4'-phosphopantetheinyl transferase [Moraxella macacae 0408225]
MQIYHLTLANAWLAIANIDEMLIDEILANQVAIDSDVCFATTNFATTNFTKPKPKSKSSLACRQLLSQLQIAIHQIGELNESEFPYCFIANSQKWFVSFSHSQYQVAVLLANVANIGVDIENKPIKSGVVRRFFSQAENQWLGQIDMEHAQLAKTLLWTLKESHIKATNNKATNNQQNNQQTNQNSQQNLTLAKGLGVNVLQWARFNELGLLLQNNKPYNELILANAVIGFLPNFQCGWWVGRSL